jgi:hypothetical protein
MIRTVRSGHAVALDGADDMNMAVTTAATTDWKAFMTDLTAC